ncbi:hypothetical protein DENSPDRAFT_884422 [Dentipellis sp. KUC8613]|nr:hypothetical protein DENSPDRAFT_884422 [Dentipellis sp. KUC8613]
MPRRALFAPHPTFVSRRALFVPHLIVFCAPTPSMRPVPMFRASPAVCPTHGASSMPRHTGFVLCHLRSPSHRLRAPWGCLLPLPVIFTPCRALSMPGRTLFAPRPHRRPLASLVAPSDAALRLNTLPHPSNATSRPTDADPRPSNEVWRSAMPPCAPA